MIELYRLFIIIIGANCPGAKLIGVALLTIVAVQHALTLVVGQSCRYRLCCSQWFTIGRLTQVYIGIIVVVALNLTDIVVGIDCRVGCNSKRSRVVARCYDHIYRLCVLKFLTHTIRHS